MLKHIFITFLVVTLLCYCTKDSNFTPYEPPTLSNDGVFLSHSILKTISDSVEVRNGGYGSAATAHPIKKGEFYAMTDRGPNAKVSGGKIFPTPSYAPRIGHFKLTPEGSIEKIKDIIIKNPNSINITGLPNPNGLGSTGEIAYDENMNIIGTDDYGLDPEGLVALRNGEFWISDEYGPHIVHLDENGRQIERISPVGINTGERKLPAVFSRRRANRGMEGLAITKDGKTLVGIMQSTMYNPSKSEAVNRTVTRIVTFDISDGNTKQYLYKQEKDNNSNSEIVALSNTEFLVIERDGKFQGNESVQKHVYRIDISNATDVSGDFNNSDGYTINDKTIEQCTWEEIKNAGIKAVTKQLSVDLVSSLGKYPHDKLEGLWIINESKLGVLNDDDFAVSSTAGQLIQKILPGSTDIDGNKLYIVNY